MPSYKEVYDKVEALRESGVAATTLVYGTLSGCFDLYCLILKNEKELNWNVKTIKKAIKKRTEATGYFIDDNKRNNIQLAIVRHVFGDVDRRQVSKYALCLKRSYQRLNEIKEADSFVGFLEDNGGISGVVNEEKEKREDDKLSYVKRNIVFSKNLFSIPNTLKDIKKDECFLMLGFYNGTEIQVKHIEKNEKLLDAVLKTQYNNIHNVVNFDAVRDKLSKEKAAQFSQLLKEVNAEEDAA